MLALHVSDIRKTLPDEAIRFYTEELLLIPDKISEILSDTSQVEALAKKYSCKNDFFFIAVINNGTIKSNHIHAGIIKSQSFFGGNHIAKGAS